MRHSLKSCRASAQRLGMAALIAGAADPGSATAATIPSRQSDFYRIARFEIPEGVVLEAGALQWMPDGQLAVSTRFGDIYLVRDPLAASPSPSQFRLFASGLHEVLGLTVSEGWLYAVQRGEVTRMRDRDGDGRADVFETVNDQWGINGDYHEYAFGSKMDPERNIWLTLCLTGSFTSENLFRGWCLRVNADGTLLPTASGIRSPGGMGTNALGDMFYTDNQGPWNGTSGLKHLAPGSFQGNPSGNRWYASTDALGPRPTDPESNSRFPVEAKRIPQYLPAAVLFPYNKMGQSASGIATDASGGKFGPFSGQLFVGDQTHSTVMRVHLEKINGRYQGACFPFLEGFGSGTLSLEFGPTGALFVGGTDRGWGARGGKPFALERVNWTGKTPFEIHEMRARPDGFEFTFTEPVDPASAENPASYRVETYTYVYRADYGSPEVDGTRPAIVSVRVGNDGRSVRLTLDRVQEGHVHEVHLPGLKNRQGATLLNPAAYYTLNQIPATATR